jgi:hypothetical protein
MDSDWTNFMGGSYACAKHDPQIENQRRPGDSRLLEIVGTANPQ